jgi:hypothetical protein
MTLRIANIDRVDDDADGDVLYLAASDPERAVDFDETPEGHACAATPTARSSASRSSMHER